jgi:DNA-binding MarR family transcriptional regulator
MNISKAEIPASVPLAAFARRLDALIPRLCRAMLRYERFAVAGSELTVAQLWAMDLLQEVRSCSMHELAEELQLKSSSATALADHLEALAMIERFRPSGDRRVVRVRLTQDGRRFLAGRRSAKIKGIRKIFSPLTPAERVQYLKLVEKMARDLAGTASKGTAP